MVLRAYRKADFIPWHEVMSDPDVVRHLGGPMSKEDVWRRMAGAAGMWALVGFGGWAVDRKEDGRLIGTVGLFNFWRDMSPVLGDEPEMGWTFASDLHGQGYASEACRAVLDWAGSTRPGMPIWANIAPENHPSLALAERLGFERQCVAIYKDEPMVVLRREPLPAASAASAAAAT